MGGAWKGQKFAFGGGLYMVGDNDILYLVNRSTGSAERVGTSTRFGQSSRFQNPESMAFHNDVLYMVARSNNDYHIYSVNIDTGVATFILTRNSLRKIASNGTTMYGLDSSRRLYTFDPALVTTAGDGALRLITGISTIRSIAFAPDGTLYVVGDASPNLYTVNTSTGAATRVGSLGLANSLIGMTFVGNTLFVTSRITDALYTVNTSTGAATRVGSATQFGVNEASPRALAA